MKRMYPLDAGVPTGQPTLIYITRPVPAHMELLSEHIKRHAESGQSDDYEYHIFFVPRKTIVCERVLEVRPEGKKSCFWSHWRFGLTLHACSYLLQSAGVYGDITAMRDVNLSLLPLDSDCMSMELELAFRDYRLVGDTTSIFYVAHSIMQLQFLFGIIPRIAGKGKMAKVGGVSPGAPGEKVRWTGEWSRVDCHHGVLRDGSPGFG